MDQLTQVKVSTTETVAKDLPNPAREDLPIPSNPNTLFLGGLFLFATLAIAYFAAEVILPIVLAFVLMLLLSPGMRVLSRLRFPRFVSAILLILGVVTALFALGLRSQGRPSLGPNVFRRASLESRRGSAS